VVVKETLAKTFPDSKKHGFMLKWIRLNQKKSHLEIHRGGFAKYLCQINLGYDIL
jgi:hypothetical protein